MKLPDKDTILKKGKLLYKGIRECVKGPLKSLEHFYVTDKKSVAERYAAHQLCMYTVPRDMKLLKLTIPNIKFILKHFEQNNLNVIKFATGVNTSLGEQESLLNKLVRQKRIPKYLKTYARKYYKFQPCDRTGCRISVHEVDKLFSQVLCSKFLKKYGYDGYYAGKLQSEDDIVFHSEIMLCNASEIIQSQVTVPGERCPRGFLRSKVTGMCEPKDQVKKTKRCPNGFRKNKVSGMCEPKGQVKKTKRCPNGFRKNRVTGICIVHKK